MKEYGKEDKHEGKESALQSSCYKMVKRIKGSPLVFHVPNQRQQSSIRGGIWKAQGVVAGIPDLVIPHARGGYNGLAVELKVKGGRLTDDQKMVIDRFEKEGWKTALVWSRNGMKELITEYWGSLYG